VAEGFTHIVILVTTDSAAAAEQLAGRLVETGKVACVNIVPAVDSVFRWQGAVEREREALLVVKARAARLDEVVAMVRAHHPYEVPEVIALPIIGGNADYLAWLDTATP